MSFFISEALAEGAAGAQQAPDMSGLIFMGAIFLLFYFLLFRPQAKRAKEHKKMTESLAKGDEVVTNGGILGTVRDLDENFITLEVAEGVSLKVQRQAVASLMPKGTLKSE